MKVLTNEFSTRSVYPMFAWALEYASEELQDNEDIVREGVKQNGKR